MGRSGADCVMLSGDWAATVRLHRRTGNDSHQRTPCKQYTRLDRHHSHESSTSVVRFWLFSCLEAFGFAWKLRWASGSGDDGSTASGSTS